MVSFIAKMWDASRAVETYTLKINIRPDRLCNSLGAEEDL